MAKRYSRLTVVVLMGAFALVGYLGARVSEKQALRDNVGSPPPAIDRADETKAVAPSERTGEVLAAKTPADTAKSVAAPADTGPPTPLAAAPPLAPSASESTAVSPAPELVQPTPPWSGSARATAGTWRSRTSASRASPNASQRRGNPS